MPPPKQKLIAVRLNDANYFGLPGLKGQDIFPSYSKYNSIVLMEICCNYFGVTEKEVRGWRRFRRIVTARQVFFYLLKKFTKLTLTGIGKEFNRDHTTIIHSIKTVNGFIQIDPDFKKDIENIETILYGTQTRK